MFGCEFGWVARDWLEYQTVHLRASSVVKYDIILSPNQFSFYGNRLIADIHRSNVIELYHPVQNITFYP